MGQATRAGITVFRPTALKRTDMSDAATRIVVILWSLRYKAEVNLCHLVEDLSKSEVPTAT